MREEAFRVFGFVAFGLVLALGALAVIQMLSVSPLWSERGAAWVQAIGSIGAIWTAIYILNRQNKNTERLQRRAEEMAIFRKYSAIGAIAEHADNLIQDAYTNIRAGAESRITYFEIGYDAEAFESVGRALSAIPLHDLGSFAMVVAVRDLSDATRGAADNLARVGVDPNAFVTDISEPIACLIGHSAKARNAIADFKISMRNLGLPNY